MELQLKIRMLLESVRERLNLSLQSRTPRHTLAPHLPQPPAPNPASNSKNQTKGNCLADKCGVYLAKGGISFRHHTFPSSHQAKQL